MLEVACPVEILPPQEGLVRISAANHPVRWSERVDLELPAGLSLQEILEASQPDPALRAHAAIQIGDRAIPKHLWPRVRPKPGTRVFIRILPSDTETLGIVLGVVIVVIGIFTGNPGLIISGLTILTGAIVAQALSTDLNRLSGQTDASPTLLIGQTRNRERKFGPIPRLFGRHRLFPDLGVKQFTEVQGNKEILFGYFVWGYGPLTLPEAQRIGDTPLEQFKVLAIEHRQGWPPDPRSFTATEVDTLADSIAIAGHLYIDGNQTRLTSDGTLPAPLQPDTDYWVVGSVPEVSMQLALEDGGDPIDLTDGGSGGHTVSRFEPPIALFPDQVEQEPFDLPLSTAWTVRSTKPETDRISFDITFHEGLVEFEDDGDKRDVQVTIETQFAPSPGVKQSFAPIDVNVATDRIALAGHPYLDGQTVDFTTDGTLPPPLQARTDYYVVGATAGDLQVSLTKGGPAVNLAGGGTGNHSIVQHDWSADPVGKAFALRNLGTLPRPSALVQRFREGGDRVVARSQRFLIGLDVHTGALAVKRGNPALHHVISDGPGAKPPVEFGVSVPQALHPRTVPLALIERRSDDPEITPASRIADLRQAAAPFGSPPPGGDFKATGIKNGVAIAAGTLSFIGLVTKAKQATLIRRSVEFDPGARGTWDVRWRRTTPDSGDVKVRDRAAVTALRSITAEDPWNLPGIARTAMMIQATDEIPSLDRYSAVMTSYLPWWTGSAWTLAPSRNPAGAARELLQGPANSDPRPASRLDLAGHADFHDYCATNGFTFDLVVDFETTLEEVYKLILAAGRAGPARPDGKLGQIIDELQGAPVGILTPRNSRGFSGRLDLRSPPEAVRVRFVNAAADWQPDEVVVFADGFDDNSAKRYQSAQMIGVTDAELVWKHTRVRIAERERRAEGWSVECDAEALTFTRGKTILFAHDVIKSALGSARVKAIATDVGGDAVGLTLDQTVTQSIGESYAVSIRTVNDVALIVPLVTVPGASKTVVLATPIPPAQTPVVGDLLVVGRTTEKTVDALVTDIESGADLSFRVSLVPAAPEIHQADQGPLPPLTTTISEPAVGRRPAVQQVRSDEEVLIRDSDGSFKTQVLISLVTAARPSDDFDRTEVATRIAGTDADWRRETFPIGDQDLGITAVTDGETYEIRLRYLGTSGRTGPWTAVLLHQVIGVSRPPPDVAALFRQGSQLTWPYPLRPRDTAGFQVRMHRGVNAVWASAEPLHPDLVLDPPFDIAPWAGGTRTFLVKAFDTSGNESLGAAALVVGFGEPVTENIVLKTAYAPLFPGTVTGGAVAAGVLQATGDGEFWLADDANVIWSGDDKALYWAPQFQEMVYTASYEPAGGARLFLDLGIEALDGHKLEIAADLPRQLWSGQDQTPAWSGVDSAPWWTALAGQFFGLPPGQPVAKQPYSLRLTTFAGTNHAMVERFTARLDVPDVEETVEDLAVAAAGTRLPLQKLYSVIKGVELTLQDDGGAAALLKLVDKDPLVGPLVKAFDAVGAAATATIDATVKGYLFQ